MFETGLLDYLLLTWSGLSVVHGTPDDRDSLNFERETSFIFDLRATRGVHIIIIVDILYTTKDCYYSYRTARFYQSCTGIHAHTI